MNQAINDSETLELGAEASATFLHTHRGPNEIGLHQMEQEEAFAAVVKKYPVLGWGCTACALTAWGWAIVKASIIGYYPGEFDTQVGIPMAVGFGFASVVWLLMVRESRNSG